MKKRSITRNNHYVPVWYQKGFLADGQKKLHYLDLMPDEIQLPNGRKKHSRPLSENYPKRCFFHRDLYSTFLGTQLNDEIERKLFGEIDRCGAQAIQAFINDDTTAWIQNFKALFLYLDAQKLRTPKGLEWIRAHYPHLGQNDLMMEMLEVRQFNCALWSEGVKEIVSAREAKVKFIITDHPVTIYNPAYPPSHELCQHHADPSISLKGSQTLFPLDRDHCLILTHLEYAKTPGSCDPLEKRTFARQMRQSVVIADAFIKKRKLNDSEVIAINSVLKSRGYRFIAAGEKEQLLIAQELSGIWKDVQKLLLPPTDELYNFEGEMYMQFENGDVGYQDAFGRSTPVTAILNKDIKESEIGANDLCGCGSGRKYKKCCRGIPENLRPSWKDLGIRERNLAFFRGVNDILGIGPGKDWQHVRKVLDEDKVNKIHKLHSALWPNETDIFELLPKPDGRTRAVYSGLIHPRITPAIVYNACLFFGDVLVQNPFIHPSQIKRKFNPIENPHVYLDTTLMNLALFFDLYPLIERGHVNFFPDPLSLDISLRTYLMKIAPRRQHSPEILKLETRAIEIDDVYRQFSMFSRDDRKKIIRKAHPKASEEKIEQILNYFERIREQDTLVLLRDGVYKVGEDGGQINMLQLVPNFELLLLIAQSTGASVITDSHYRWKELCEATHREGGIHVSRIPKTTSCAETYALPICGDFHTALTMFSQGKLASHRVWFDRLYCCLREFDAPLDDDLLFEAFKATVTATQKDFERHSSNGIKARFKYVAPVGGIHHNHVTRLMIRCGIDERPNRVPLAVFMDIQKK